MNTLPSFAACCLSYSAVGVSPIDDRNIFVFRQAPVDFDFFYKDFVGSEPRSAFEEWIAVAEEIEGA